MALNAYSSEVHKVLDVALKIDPDSIWKVCEAILADADSSRAYYVGRWLTGSLVGQQTEPAIKKISPNALWEWVEEQPAERARYLAMLLPHDLLSEERGHSLSRALLVRYGKLRDVRSALVHNYLTEGWAGPASAHYSAEKNRLLSYKSHENNEFVKRFVDDLIEVLDRQIERALVEEERERF